MLISKHLFYEKISKELKCHELIHPWAPNSCSQAFFITLREVAIGSSKFYLPIYVIKLLINSKKINNNYLKDTLKAYIRSVVYGILIGSLILSTNCALGHITGRIHYYNIGLLSGTISGLALFVESIENRNMNALLFFNLVLELILKNLNYFQIINFTKTKQTIIFMFISAYLMYLLDKNDMDFFNLWFYNPRRSSSVAAKNQNYMAHCFNGFQKYFLLGFELSIVKKLLSQFGQMVKNPFRITNIFIGMDNVQFGLFFGTYVALYRIITTYLLEYYENETSIHPLIAGFLSGVAFAFKPNIHVFNVGLITIMQLLFNKCVKSNSFVSKLPLRELLFMCSFGVLTHNRFIFMKTCPKYFANMLHIATNKLDHKTFSNMIKLLFLL